MSKKQFFLTTVTSALVGGMVAVGSMLALQDDSSVPLTEYMERQNVRLASYFESGDFTVPEGLNFVYAAETATPAVVHIRSKYGANAASRPQSRHPLEEMFPDLFEEGTPGPRRGGMMPQGSSGSGVILSADGYIVTNNHVIDRADQVEVTLNDNRSYTAEVIGVDPTTDIALLKVDATDLPYLSYGNSESVKVGEWVLAVGNPLDLTSTVTAGIVSAKGRNIGILGRGSNIQGNVNTAIESFIQTDAAVNPGNSGGALVNLRGELIGINTAIASPTGSYSGYSFAVPATLVSKIVRDLKEFGTVQRALLGVQIQDVNAQLAKERELKVNRGVYINTVTSGSAAEEAGLKVGDVVVEINNRPVNTVAQLQEVVAINRPGDKVKVTYYRDGKVRTADAVLKNGMGTTTMLAKSNTLEIGGSVLANLSDADKARLKISKGVKVQKLGAGKLRDAKVKEGFIITAIDHKPIENVDDAAQILSGKRNEGTLLEGVYPDGQKAYYGLPW
ncbi:Do family serine endopeptidase [Cesiribacter andamanensis]|uniref:Putative periplasmic serine endoprotease DegP-like n=1 Tax=Cesiribacter andamanensis AMV16 TaxID=1279009 RepID=M7P266_9BACT|nr:Do family serine endopeptidase [Cesiribacter andamanensis]EMR04664.1 putative periplasmic serine endoprotease DegP-like precursor [Cesiribacter andamanensis AMV16]